MEDLINELLRTGHIITIKVTEDGSISIKGEKVYPIPIPQDIDWEAPLDGINIKPESK